MPKGAAGFSLFWRNAILRQWFGLPIRRRMPDEDKPVPSFRSDCPSAVRAIAVCNDRAALFVINYSSDEKIPYDPIVVRMVRSLKAEGC